MIEARIRSFALATPDEQGNASFKVLGFCKFDFRPLNMTISGVTLTWSKERGYCAMPPNAPVKNGDGLAVRWAHDSLMARSILDLMVQAFEGMGGVLPAPHGAEEEQPDNSGLHRTVGAA